MATPEVEIHPELRSYEYLNWLTFKCEKYKDLFFRSKMFSPLHHNFALRGAWARNHPYPKNKDEEH